jgi:hypothetical protein
MATPSNGIADRVLTLMRKHRRTTYLTAAKIGLTMRQYQRAVTQLRARVAVHSLLQAAS